MSPTTDAAPSGGILARIGLDRPELRAWAMYDWANSGFLLSVATTIFPIFFASVASAGVPGPIATQRFSWITSIALLAVAAMAPFLGALADFAGIKKRLLALFVATGVLATLSMFFIREGDWLLAAILFGVANVGAQGSFVFYDSLLPHVARREEMDRVSTAGFAVGYFGSSILLAVQLAWISRPDLFGLPSGEGLAPDAASLPARLAFVSAALWWVVFSIPLFRGVPEPPRRLEADERPGQAPARVALRRLIETFREMRLYRQAFLFLIAFLIYNDGIGTIIRMAAIYGREIGIGPSALIGSIFVVQLIGIPFAFLFGALAGRIGAKRAILAGLAVYVGVAVYAYFIDSALEFFVLAVLVGMVQGGTQGLSRSLFASMIPAHKSTEFFGFYGLVGRFAGILGTAVFAVAIALTGSSRQAILSVIAFFVVGGYFLTRVRVEEGREAARRAAAGVSFPHSSTRPAP